MATKVDPSIPSSAYSAMSPQWEKVNALCGGTDAMRAARIKYLPKWSEELPDQYTGRIDRSFLDEFFKTTSDRMAAKPFSQPIDWETENDKLKTVMEEDVDLLGNNLDVFAYRLLKIALRKGMVGVLVDHSGTGTEKTLADVKATGARAFLREIHPDTVLECSTERVGAEEVVTRLRILGYEEADDPNTLFGKVHLETVTVFTPETIEEWRRPRKAKGRSNREEWTKASSVPNVLGKVYFRMFYADRTGHMTSDLPLSGVIDKSIELWQSQSNQRVALDVARFPMLAAKGITQDEIQKVALGPLAVLATESFNGEFYYVENEGKALDAGRKDIADIKAAMAEAVADLYATTGPSSRASAAEAGNKASESTSIVRTLCINFSDFLETVMYSAAEVQGIPDAEIKAAVGEININDDYAMDANMAKEMEALSSARDRGDLSQEEWVREMKRRRTLDPKEEFKGGPPPVKPGGAPSPANPSAPVARDTMSPEGTGGSS